MSRFCDVVSNLNNIIIIFIFYMESTFMHVKQMDTTTLQPLICRVEGKASFTALGCKVKLSVRLLHVISCSIRRALYFSRVAAIKKCFWSVGYVTHTIWCDWLETMITNATAVIMHLHLLLHTKLTHRCNCTLASLDTHILYITISSIIFFFVELQVYMNNNAMSLTACK